MGIYGKTVVIFIIGGLAVYFNFPASRNVDSEGSTAETLLEDSPSDSTLVKAYIIFRHGERSPIRGSPHYKYNPQDWPDGPGALTKLGKMNSYLLGQRLRKRYNSILLPHYSKNNLVAQSTQVERTLMTAYLVLAGMYPPADHQVWNNKLKWTPIPVYHDSKSHNFYNCSRFQHAAIEALKDIGSSFLEAPRAILKEKAGIEITPGETEVSELFELYDTFVSIKNQKTIEIESWANEYVESMRQTMNTLFQGLTVHSSAQKQLSCSLVGDSLLRFVDEPNQVRLGSAHDLSLYVVSATLGFELQSVPSPTACIVVEFHRKDEQDFVKSFYFPSVNSEMSPIEMSCGVECSFPSFQEMLLKLKPANYDALCDSGGSNVDLPYFRGIKRFMLSLHNVLP